MFQHVPSEFRDPECGNLVVGPGLLRHYMPLNHISAANGTFTKGTKEFMKGSHFVQKLFSLGVCVNLEIPRS